MAVQEEHLLGCFKFSKPHLEFALNTNYLTTHLIDNGRSTAVYCWCLTRFLMSNSLISWGQVMMIHLTACHILCFITLILYTELHNTFAVDSPSWTSLTVSNIGMAATPRCLFELRGILKLPVLLWLYGLTWHKHCNCKSFLHVLEYV